MNASAEAEIRAIVEERIAAVQTKDLAPLEARQHAEVLGFDVLPPLQRRGSAAISERTQAWFDSYASDIGYEVHDLQVTVDGDVGFCSFLYHVTGTLEDGTEVSMWVRATLAASNRPTLAHHPRSRVRAIRSCDRSSPHRPRALITSRGGRSWAATCATTAAYCPPRFGGGVCTVRGVPSQTPREPVTLA
jgi:ketosteroid isomerase-like protein